MKFTSKTHRYYYKNVLYQFQRKRILLFTFFFLNVSNFLSYKNLRTINDDFLLNYHIVYIIKNLTYNNVE